MKKLFNYSLILFLFSFVAFACSKEDGEMEPSASLMRASHLSLDGYKPVCLDYEKGRISLELKGYDLTTKANKNGNKGRGLSHLNLEITDCWSNSLELEGSISNPTIEHGGKTYEEGKDFILEYSDGSCTPATGTMQYFVKFEILNENLNQALRIGQSFFSFDWGGTSEIGGANVIIKTGNGCFQFEVATCDNYCEPPKDGDCTRTQGYWKTHGDGHCQKGKNQDAWPIGFGLTIAGVEYDAAGLCELLNTPVRGSNLGLVHQLIATELNIQALGAKKPDCLADAYAWLALYGINSNTKNSDLIECLTEFNESSTGNCAE